MVFPVCTNLWCRAVLQVDTGDEYLSALELLDKARLPPGETQSKPTPGIVSKWFASIEASALERDGVISMRTITNTKYYKISAKGAKCYLNKAGNGFRPAPPKPMSTARRRAASTRPIVPARLALSAPPPAVQQTRAHHLVTPPAATSPIGPEVVRPPSGAAPRAALRTPANAEPGEPPSALLVPPSDAPAILRGAETPSQATGKRRRQKGQMGDTPFNRTNYSPMSDEVDDKEATDMKQPDVADLVVGPAKDMKDSDEPDVAVGQAACRSLESETADVRSQAEERDSRINQQDHEIKMLRAELEETRASLSELQDKLPTTAAKIVSEAFKHAGRLYAQSKVNAIDYFDENGFPHFPSLEERYNFWTGPRSTPEMRLATEIFYKLHCSETFVKDNRTARLHDPACTDNWQPEWGDKPSDLSLRRCMNKPYQRGAGYNKSKKRGGELAPPIPAEQCGAWAERRERCKKAQVLANLEILALSRWHGKNPMPGLVEDVLNVRWIGGLTVKAHNLASIRRLFLSRTWTDQLIEKLTKRYEARWLEVLKSQMALEAELAPVGSERTVAVFTIWDNYVVLRWVKIMVAGENFTKQATTISVVFIHLRYVAARLLCNDADRPTAHPQFSAERVLVVLQHEALLSDEVLASKRREAVSEATPTLNRDVLPTLPITPRVRQHDFVVAPSQPLKTSRTDDHMKMQEFLRATHVELGLPDADIRQVVDSEPALIVDKLAAVDPECVKKLVIYLAPCHLLKDGIERLACNAIDFKQIGFPLLGEFFNYRKAHFARIAAQRSAEVDQHLATQMQRAAINNSEDEMSLEEGDDGDDEEDDEGAALNRLCFVVTPINAAAASTEGGTGVVSDDACVATEEPAVVDDDACVTTEKPAEPGEPLADFLATFVVEGKSHRVVNGGANDDSDDDNDEGWDRLWGGDIDDDSGAHCDKTGSTRVDDSAMEVDDDNDKPRAADESKSEAKESAGRNVASEQNGDKRDSTKTATEESYTGTSHKQKAEMKVNFARLLYFYLVLFDCFKAARESVVAAAQRAYCEAHRGTTSVDEESSLEWACQKSVNFRYYWEFLEHELRMWIECMEAWEDGDALPLHKHLPVMILHIAYGSNTKYWRRANIVPWLMSYLGRALYWSECRDYDLKVLGLECQKLLDFVIEWHNNLTSQNIPANTKVDFDVVKKAAMAVQVKHAFEVHYRDLYGRSMPDAHGEIANKRAQIKRPALQSTIEKGANWVKKLFDDGLEVALGRAEPTCVFVDKARVAHGDIIEKFARNHEAKLEKSRHTTSGPAAEAGSAKSGRSSSRSKGQASSDIAALERQFYDGTLDIEHLRRDDSLKLVKALAAKRVVEDGRGSRIDKSARSGRRNFTVQELRKRIEDAFKKFQAAPLPPPASA